MERIPYGWVVVLLFSIAVSSSVGCDGGSEDDTDAGTDARQDDGGKLTRTLVEGTKGYCLTAGKVDDACESAADCIGYQVPFDYDCCGPFYILNPAGCAFANRETFPESPDCTADEACLVAPRDCVGGRCVVVVPDRSCKDDADCKLFDTGCECAPAAGSVVSYNPEYGMGCPKRNACPADANPVCVDGFCHYAGTFMDDAIDAFCTMCGGVDGFLPAENCVEGLAKDDYSPAAAWWPVLDSAGLADDCGALLKGPFWHFVECVSWMCP